MTRVTVITRVQAEVGKYMADTTDISMVQT
jgi:hypothetical protein